jgi:hypothetical protein
VPWWQVLAQLQLVLVLESWWQVLLQVCWVLV